MAERVRKAKQTSSNKTEEVQADAAEADAKQNLKDEIDAFLDEIDDLLEENAEEFVAAYIQKGGQ